MRPETRRNLGENMAKDRSLQLLSFLLPVVAGEGDIIITRDVIIYLILCSYIVYIIYNIINYIYLSMNMIIYCYG